MGDSLSTHHVRGWLLVGSGCVYAFFYGPQFAGLDFGAPWSVALAVHAVLLILTMWGLVAAIRTVGPDGWPLALWWLSTLLAFMGLTVGKPFWSAALIGLAVLALIQVRSVVVASLLAAGAALWLYLFATGVRIGDENGRALIGEEPMIALTAVVFMAIGLIGLGMKVVNFSGSRLTSRG
jgi:hypothetical protein